MMKAFACIPARVTNQTLPSLNAAQIWRVVSLLLAPHPAAHLHPVVTMVHCGILAQPVQQGIEGVALQAATGMSLAVTEESTQLAGGRLEKEAKAQAAPQAAAPLRSGKAWREWARVLPLESASWEGRAGKAKQGVEQHALVSLVAPLPASPGGLQGCWALPWTQKRRRTGSRAPCRARIGRWLAEMRPLCGDGRVVPAG